MHACVCHLIMNATYLIFKMNYGNLHTALELETINPIAIVTAT